MADSFGPAHDEDEGPMDHGAASREEPIRVLVVDRIPLPENPELAKASRRIGIITEDTRCVGFGRALIIRVDAWNDPGSFGRLNLAPSSMPASSWE